MFTALQMVLIDENRSARDKAIGKVALDKAKAIEKGIETGVETGAEIIPIPIIEPPEAGQMLAALGKKHIAKISEDEWMSSFAKNHTTPSEVLIREWRFRVAPDEGMPELLTGQDHVGSTAGTRKRS